MTLLAELANVSVAYGDFLALRRVSLGIAAGEIVGVVGESGSGKTTALRALMGLAPVAEGSVRFQGDEITHVSSRQRREIWRNMQLVFQDPSASLSPRRSIEASIIEPMLAHGVARPAAVQRATVLLAEVGLSESLLRSSPAALSGGQRQRVAIARALALQPRLIVADEPMSALDVSVKAQIAALFLKLRERTNTAFLLVSHDLALMSAIADRLVVMERGRVVEAGAARQIVDAPADPYTQRLRAACLEPEAVVRDRLASSGAAL